MKLFIKILAREHLKFYSRRRCCRNSNIHENIGFKRCNCLNKFSYKTKIYIRFF